MNIEKSSSLKNLKLQGVRVGVVWARFNEKITGSLLEGSRRALLESGLKESEIDIFDVPGAFEIPLMAQSLAQSKKYAGIICLGAVIRGDTPHFDYVCKAATEGILEAQLKTGIPMAFGVLTLNTMEQAIQRSGPGNDNKGFEAGQVVVEMILQLEKVKAI